MQPNYREIAIVGHNVTQMERDTKKYELYNGNRLVYVGITNDLARRESEHHAEGMRFTRMEQVGRASTRKSAGDWEADRIQTYMSHHHGETPEYNQNTTGK